MPLSIFISYRHGDSDGDALLLHDRLSRRFGTDSVFLDVKSLGIGTRWLQDIKSHGSRGGVLLALIGRSWLSMLKEREAAPAVAVDFVQMELEMALDRWGVQVIPVLVGDARMPDAVSLPRPLRPLASLHAVELRHETFDDGVLRLLTALGRIEREIAATSPNGAGENAAEGNRATEPTGPGTSAPEVLTDRSPADEPVGVDERALRRREICKPEDSHYESVLDYMIDGGTVVPILGPRLRGTLPDADALAGLLAERFKLSPRPATLAGVAQEVAITEGPSFLARELREALRGEQQPTALHRFLASFPGRLAKRKLPPRYQMIVSTGYDVGLEQAFEDAGEPYDLAVFVPGGQDEGKFAHVPWRGDPTVIPQPSLYRGFPIDGYDELERTVIVKVLGEANWKNGGLTRERGLVITEDQYIDYLVTEQIGSVIPLQILNKLTSSHCLFVGYAMRDWSLRVFLRRIWQGGPLEDRSWAVEDGPDELEKDFWSSLHVELLSGSPDEYARRLEELFSTPRSSV
jgi:hypothetical protein